MQMFVHACSHLKPSHTVGPPTGSTKSLGSMQAFFSWKQCLKFQQDKRQNAVRQVEEQAQVQAQVLSQQQMPSPLGTSTQAPVPGQAVSSSANLCQGQQPQMRRVEFAPCWGCFSL